eukprot:TRINITY_DN67704_c6_g1_i2.p1 TRINITY_DN67704_c6_g1~~TRINITY_DN67704_c6_g1_i2.p1  ORF type:complete len:144 (-),score=54.71 TRINITY_DN67704_c6_g1_i2:67-465(-)
MTSSSSWVFHQPSSTAVFCTQCHTLLDLPDDHEVMQCPSCPFKATLSDFEHGRLSVSAAGQQQADASIQNQDAQGSQYGASASFKRATVKEPCPQCGYKKMTFYTLQLRSVDEGQTVFYECPKCSHAYSTNT